MSLVKGMLLGIVIFVILVFVMAHQRATHGLSTPLSAFTRDIFWWLVLLVCLAAGWLISNLTFKRRVGN